MCYRRHVAYDRTQNNWTNRERGLVIHLGIVMGQPGSPSRSNRLKATSWRRTLSNSERLCRGTGFRPTLRPDTLFQVKSPWGDTNAHVRYMYPCCHLHHFSFCVNWQNTFAVTKTDQNVQMIWTTWCSLAAFSSTFWITFSDMFLNFLIVETRTASCRRW